MRNNRKYKSTAPWYFTLGGVMVAVALVWLVLLLHLKGPEARYQNPDESDTSFPQDLKTSPRAARSPIARYEIKSQTVREVSAYNAGDINQGSGDPCVSANGENICVALDQGKNRCAANFVPFGTKLLLESVDTSWRYQCVVVDRMNKRYRNRVDIAMKKDEKPRALKFGLQKLRVSVLEE